uniref:MARVEL domain-containing protein n=1 Tax=Bactrocera latifrons TaxID=174628 RepID=A0A0K8V6T3_BACLA
MFSTSGYDRLYVRSSSGLAKLLCMLCAVAGITCIAVSLAPVTNLRGLVYMCVMACACLGSALVFLNNFCEMRFCRRHFCNATRFELYIHATLAVLCFLASSAALTLALVTYSIAAVRIHIHIHAYDD